MELLRRIHRAPTKSQLKKLWELGTFVFDTNVLLDLYRLPVSAKDDLVKIIVDPKISNRIWLPFQAYLEFFNNRLSVICEQKNAFGKVRSLLSDAAKSLETSKADYSKKLDDLKVDKRHSRITSSQFGAEKIFQDALEGIAKLQSELSKLEGHQPDVHENDTLQTQLLKAFRGRIGTSFSQEELNEIYDEGAKRYKDNLPPGHKDADKDLSNHEPKVYQFEEKSYRRSFGDLVLWKEILRKVEADEIQYVALITNDTKENWLEERRGKRLGVRHELLNEIYFHAKCVKLFHIYDTTSFMQYAKQSLEINVTDKSIAETKELLDLKTQETADSDGYELHTLLFGGSEVEFGQERIGAVRFYFNQPNSVQVAHNALRLILGQHRKIMTEVAVDSDEYGFYAETAFTIPMSPRSIEQLSRSLRLRGMTPSTYMIEPWSDG